VHHTISFLLILTFVALFTVSCVKSDFGSGDHSPPTTKASAAKLDIDIARRTLIIFIENSSEPMIKRALPDLSRSAADKHTEDAVIFGFGELVEVNITSRSWNILGPSQPSTRWVFEGEFRQNEKGDWEATETSRHEQMFNGSY